VLSYYIQQTSRLLQNPASPTTLYSAADLTSYINTARGQLAGEAECIRILGTLATVVGQQAYNFSSINLGTPATTGAQGVIHVRSAMYAVGSGLKWFRPRNWEWFQLYGMNNPVPTNGPPLVWAQYGQGSASQGTITNVGTGSIYGGGSFYINPPPDLVYTLTLDCVCYPQALVLDTDVEAIPYLWTDCVPYFAAYMALLSAQTSARMQEAERYKAYYTEFVQRARKASTPDVNKFLYQQVPSPMDANKLGLQGGNG
jgi:hypothetical protein